jgi:thiamin-phosphate kinase
MEKDKSEFGLIEWIRQQSMLELQGVCVGIGDDMAVMEIGGEKILVTCDMLLEGVHFVLTERVGHRPTLPTKPGAMPTDVFGRGHADVGDPHAHASVGMAPKSDLPGERRAVHTLPAKPATLEQVGYKAMACSLSDCAAMAAVPWCAVVSVALPNSLSMTDAQQLHIGLQQAAQKHDCPIVGGDTTSWGKPLAINVTMLAKAGGVEPVLRSGAQVGDAILVTGELGGSLAGRHLEFTPRVKEARKLAELVDLHAMIDISDGLGQDLNHICTESNVGAIINQLDIPISAAARKMADPLQAALTDGEDFELLFCVGPKDAERLQLDWQTNNIQNTHAFGIQKHATQTKVNLTCIGEIVTLKDEAKIFLRDSDGNLNSITLKGWEHFQ